MGEESVDDLRRHAEQARRLADSVQSAETKEELLQIARMFEAAARKRQTEEAAQGNEELN